MHKKKALPFSCTAFLGTNNKIVKISIPETSIGAHTYNVDSELEGIPPFILSYSYDAKVELSCNKIHKGI